MQRLERGTAIAGFRRQHVAATALGNAGSDRFIEYGRKNDGVAETLTVRAISDPAPFDTQVGKLVKSIKAGNPNTKVHILQRPNAKDVIISYLTDRANSNVSLMLWRMSAYRRARSSRPSTGWTSISRTRTPRHAWSSIPPSGRWLPIIPGRFSIWFRTRTDGAGS